MSSKEYEIKGKKYTIPEDKIDLKNTDFTGVLDQWPAFSVGRFNSNSQMVLNRNKNILVLNEKDTKLPNLVPKPKFLQFLENYLHKELHRHNVVEVKPHPARLQAYREVFEWIIEAFKMYKPILSDIKRDYEMNLAYFREEIRRLEPMKEMVWTISQERDQQILEIQRQENTEIHQMKAEVCRLKSYIAELDAQKMTTDIEIKELQSKLSQEHMSYRNEADARRLLIIDINELRQQLEDMNVIRQNQEKSESQDDPDVLRIALEEAKKAHTKVLEELNKMIADYSNVIPKRDFEALQLRHEAAIAESEKANQKLTESNALIENLQEQSTGLMQQRDFYYQKYNEMTRSSTPRPDWAKCGEFMSQGVDSWQTELKAKSSNELVDSLLREINLGSMASLSKSSANATPGKGTGPEVAAYLRAEPDTMIARRIMLKRDVKIHIREIWERRKSVKEQEVEAVEHGQTFSMSAFDEAIAQFFSETYGVQQIRLEWAYAFNEAVQNDAANSDEILFQFKSILNKTMAEDVYWDEIRLISQLFEKIHAADAEQTGTVSREALHSVVLECFPYKLPDESMVETLVQTALKELEVLEEDAFLSYEQLFMTDDEGENGQFIKEFKTIFKGEKLRLVEEIGKELADLGTAKINSEQLQKVIQTVDPSSAEPELSKFVRFVFQSDAAPEVPETTSLEREKVLEKLKFSTIRRFGSRM